MVTAAVTGPAWHRSLRGSSEWLTKRSGKQGSISQRLLRAWLSTHRQDIASAQSKGSASQCVCDIVLRARDAKEASISSRNNRSLSNSSRRRSLSLSFSLSLSLSLSSSLLSATPPVAAAPSRRMCLTTTDRRWSIATLWRPLSAPTLVLAEEIQHAEASGHEPNSCLTGTLASHPGAQQRHVRFRETVMRPRLARRCAGRCAARARR